MRSRLKIVISLLNLSVFVASMYPNVGPNLSQMQSEKKFYVNANAVVDPGGRGNLFQPLEKRKGFLLRGNLLKRSSIWRVLEVPPPLKNWTILKFLVGQ